MVRSLVAITVMALCSAGQVYAAIYKCTANGEILFSQAPCEAGVNTEEISLKVHEPTEEEKQRAAEQLEKIRAEDEAQSRQRAKQADSKPAAAAPSKAKAEDQEANTDGKEEQLSR